MKPLDGLRILITRAQEDAGPWEERIAQLGGQPVLLPCISTEFLQDATTAQRLLEALRTADWLMFTSRRAVHATVGLSPRLADSVRVAAVGSSTAEVARGAWGRVDLIGDGSGAVALGRALLATRTDLRPATRPATETEPGTLAPVAHVVIPAADRARSDVDTLLERARVKVTRIPVYCTRSLPGPGPAPTADLDPVDVVLLASPSAVDGLLHRTTVPAGAQIITIGPTTSRAARSRGLRVTAEARRPDLMGLLEAIS